MEPLRELRQSAHLTPIKQVSRSGAPASTLEGRGAIFTSELIGPKPPPVVMGVELSTRAPKDARTQKPRSLKAVSEKVAVANPSYNSVRTQARPKRRLVRGDETSSSCEEEPSGQSEFENESKSGTRPAPKVKVKTKLKLPVKSGSLKKKTLPVSSSSDGNESCGSDCSSCYDFSTDSRR